jgi:hypothetical protein
MRLHTTPHITNVGQSELLITALRKQLSVPGQVSAPNSATGHMRKRLAVKILKACSSI